MASTFWARSPTKVWARPGPDALMRLAAASRRSPDRAVIMTWAPSRARLSATPSPRPRLEERTRARLPARPRSMVGFLSERAVDDPAPAKCCGGWIMVPKRLEPFGQDHAARQ